MLYYDSTYRVLNVLNITPEYIGSQQNMIYIYIIYLYMLLVYISRFSSRSNFEKFLTHEVYFRHHNNLRFFQALRCRTLEPINQCLDYFRLTYFWRFRFGHCSCCVKNHKSNRFWMVRRLGRTESIANRHFHAAICYLGRLLAGWLLYNRNASLVPFYFARMLSYYLSY